MVTAVTPTARHVLHFIEAVEFKKSQQQQHTPHDYSSTEYCGELFYVNDRKIIFIVSVFTAHILGKAQDGIV